MRILAVLAIPLALGACATPLEQCVSSVSRDLRINESLIAETEGNIVRGFALSTEQRVRQVPSTCRGRTETGESVRVRCDETLVRNVQVPVAVDLNAERAKLASLRERNAQLRGPTAAAQRQCLAQYPQA